MSEAKWTSDAIASQAGKTALVTGANSGIGYQAALELARHGARVLLGCRDAGKGQAALQQLRREAPGANAELLLLDLASLASVRSVAEQLVAGSGALDKLDILINNAGIMALPERQLTPDGFERQFGTNHLGHFALTGLLIPALLRAPAPRVVTVASLAHRSGKIELDNLQSERHYAPWDAYNNSKLANLLFAKELDRRARAQESKLVSIPVHPGVSRTNIGAHATDLKTKLLFTVGKPLTQTDAMGALSMLYAATVPQAQGGEYIGPDGILGSRGYPKVVQPKPNALDENAARQLWEASERLTGVVYPPLA